MLCDWARRDIPIFIDIAAFDLGGQRFQAYVLPWFACMWAI